jgi:hypothetical protein
LTSARGRERVHQSFSFAAQVEGYLALFEELCGPLAPGPLPAGAPGSENTSDPAVLLSMEPTCKR